TVLHEENAERVRAMIENKTKPTDVSVDDYLASKASAQQLADAGQAQNGQTSFFLNLRHAHRCPFQHPACSLHGGQIIQMGRIAVIGIVAFPAVVVITVDRGGVGRAVPGHGALGIERYTFVGPARIAFDRLALHRIYRVKVRVGSDAWCPIEAAYGQYADFGWASPGQDDLFGFTP